MFDTVDKACKVSVRSGIVGVLCDDVTLPFDEGLWSNGASCWFVLDVSKTLVFFSPDEFVSCLLLSGCSLSNLGGLTRVGDLAFARPNKKPDDFPSRLLLTEGAADACLGTWSDAAMP